MYQQPQQGGGGYLGSGGGGGYPQQQHGLQGGGYNLGGGQQQQQQQQWNNNNNNPGSQFSSEELKQMLSLQQQLLIQQQQMQQQQQQQGMLQQLASVTSGVGSSGIGGVGGIGGMGNTSNVQVENGALQLLQQYQQQLNSGNNTLGSSGSINMGLGSQPSPMPSFSYNQEQQQQQPTKRAHRLEPVLSNSNSTNLPNSVASHLPLLSLNNPDGNVLRSYYQLSVNDLLNLPPIPSDEDYCTILSQNNYNCLPSNLPTYDQSALQAARFAELALGALANNQVPLALELSNASVMCMRNCVEEPSHKSCIYDVARAYLLHGIFRSYRGDFVRYFKYRRVCMSHLSQLNVSSLGVVVVAAADVFLLLYRIVVLVTKCQLVDLFLCITFRTNPTWKLSSLPCPITMPSHT